MPEKLDDDELSSYSNLLLDHRRDYPVTDLLQKPKQRRARNKVESGVWVDAQEEFLLLAGNRRKTSSGEEN